MARFRLLAVDLDGTLLDSFSRVPRENCDALDAARGAGVVVAVITGRRFPAAVATIQDLPLDPWLVLNSGALVKEGRSGPVVGRQMLPLATAREVLALARQAGAEPILHDGPEGEGYLLVRAEAAAGSSLAYYLEKARPAPRRVDRLDRAIERDPVQVMFASTVSRIEALESFFAPRLTGRANVFRTTYPERDFAMLDVLGPTCSKARALRFLASRHGIPAAETMAIGDNWNDLEMLEAAGLGVVMANADLALRRRGLVTTESNDCSGVARAIEKYLL